MLRSARSLESYWMSLKTGVDNLEPSKTVQSQAKEADINNIVRNFGVTREIPIRVTPPPITDFVDVFDFQSAMQVIMQAEESFSAMPADVRRRFDDNPAAFMEFCHDPKNLEEMRKLGLAKPADKPDNPPAPVPPAPAAGST